MWRYICRRSFQSLLILVGIMILTFCLFRLTAGDPTSILLGKNPSPQEVENLRIQLGADKPLLIGASCLTERYPSFDATQNLTLSTFFKISDSQQFYAGEGIVSWDGKLKFEQAFEDVVQDYRVRIQTATTTLKCDFTAEKTITIAVPMNDTIQKITVSRLQKNILNSQLFDTFKELVIFQSTPPYVSFFNYGNSLSQNEPVKTILWRGIGPSLLLMIPIFLGEIVLGIILALIATYYKDKWMDRLIMTLSVLGMSISYLAFILFGQYFLAYQYQCFPIWGFESAIYLLLPIIIGVISGVGGGIRFYRTVFVNELNKEYLRTAKAKGCSPSQIYFNHLLPNALIPIISRISVTLPFLFTGSLLLEKFFGIPGLGFAGINALANADLQLIKAIVLLSTVLFIIINLFTDILYAAVDPRIRVEKK